MESSTEVAAVQEEKKDIKECLELLKATEIIGVNVKKALADGKINMADAPLALDIIKDIQPIIDGFTGLNEVPAEAKDLDEQELIQLGLAVFNTIKKIKAA